VAGQHRSFGRPRCAEFSSHGTIGIASKILSAPRQFSKGHGARARRAAIRHKFLTDNDQPYTDIVDELPPALRATKSD
jgi:hypothetical protein